MDPAAHPSSLRSLVRHGRTALLLLAVALTFAHCLRFRRFTVDDAAISYAYSQNFAHGDGLVGTAGGERVEGYSNFSWVVLVGAMVAVCGHVLVVAKVLGLLLALVITVGSAELSAALRRRRSALDALPALLCAVSTPIPYWSMSGLENPLYLALTTWGCVRLVQEADDPQRRPWSALLFAALALTRPDGLLVAATAAVTQLWTRHQLRRLPLWLALTATPIVLHVAWRYRYYGYPWPNTYYVKVAFPVTLHELLDRSGVGWRYVLGFIDRYRLEPLLAMAPLSLITRDFRPRAAIFLVLAAIVFFPVYSRGDWMSEGRFVVGILPLLFVLASDGLGHLARLTWRPRGIPAGIIAALLLGGALVAVLVPRSLELSRARVGHYPTPVEQVAIRGRQYRGWGQRLQIEKPSTADGDAGGNLLYSGMPLVDIGWLNDVTLAHWGRNPGFVREYIFNERRPTFMRLIGYWLDAHLQDLPEFAEYVLIPGENHDGVYIARSALVVDGIDTRHATGLGEDVALVGWNLSATELSAWLLARRDQPKGSLFWRGPHATQPLIPGDGIYPPSQWRAGEVVTLRVPRPSGDELHLCFDESCTTLTEGAHGSAPVTLPATSAADVDRLLARGELEAALAALQRAHGATAALGERLAQRARVERAEGDSGAAFADFRSALAAAPALSSARRALEELRPAPRDGYHPELRVRLLDTARRFALEPSAARLTTLVALARAVGEPLPAVRAHLATGIVPADRLALAECYRDAGLPRQAAQLLPSTVGGELDRARSERIARAAGDSQRVAALTANAARGVAASADLTLTAVDGRLASNGDVRVDLVLRHDSGAVPTSIAIDGRPHSLRAGAAEWPLGESRIETVSLGQRSGRSRLAVGAASVELEVAPFSGDFESGAFVGWAASGIGFDGQPQSQRAREQLGVQGDSYVYSRSVDDGRLQSPELRAEVAEVCFFVGQRTKASGVRLERDGAATELARGKGDLAMPACLEPPANWASGAHIAVVDARDERTVVDDFVCFTAEGAPTACAGSVAARIGQ